MPPPKDKSRGHRSQRSYSRSRSRSRSPYQKKGRYVRSRSRSPRSSRRRSPASKFQQSQHRSYSPSTRKPSSKPYVSRKRSRTPSPYRKGSSPRNKSTTRPRAPQTSQQRSNRERLDQSRQLEGSRQRGRSPGQRSPGQRSPGQRSPGYTLSRQDSRPSSNRNRDRSPVYTGSSHDRFDPKPQRSWSPEQSFQGSSRAPRGRSPSPGYNTGSGPTGMLFPAAAKFTAITGPLTIPPSHKTGVKTMLNERFGLFEEDLELPLIIEDNITIGIHRRGPNMVHDSRRHIRRSFRQEDILDIHRKDEGKRPIFDREEIKAFRHDDILDDEIYEEKRTISVMHSKPRSRHDSYSSDRRIIQGKGSHHRSQYAEPQIKFDPRPDPRYESLLDENKFRDSTKVTRVQRNPNDLRHSLQKRRHDDDDDDDQLFDARKKIEAKRKHSHRDDRVQSRDRYQDRSGDRRQDRSRSSDRRQKQTTETEVLPDFSNRPGKFGADQYRSDEWMDKPEMIPKNPMYYEHDMREGEDRGSSGHGRYTRRPYRQGFRTRGSYNNRGNSNTQYKSSNYKGINFIPNFRPRGFRRPYNSNYRGRGFNKSSDHYTKSTSLKDSTDYNPNWKPASSNSGDRVWKHDLYEDKEKDESERKAEKAPVEDNREDNKPTSTT